MDTIRKITQAINPAMRREALPDPDDTKITSNIGPRRAQPIVSNPVLVPPGATSDANTDLMLVTMKA
jgi:hypothetical protein